jgi:hypothetical protein
MADFKGQKSVGESFANAMRDTGTAEAEGFDQAKDRAGTKEPRGFARLDDIVPGMEVVSLCGCCVGTVDHLEANAIELMDRDGRRHFIPVDTVARVDADVHLNTDVFETKRGWGS